MRDEGAGRGGKGAFLGLPRAQSALHVREAQVAGQVSSAPQPPGPAPWQRALASCWQMPVSAGLTLSLRNQDAGDCFDPVLVPGREHGGIHLSAALASSLRRVLSEGASSRGQSRGH